MVSFDLSKMLEKRRLRLRLWTLSRWRLRITVFGFAFLARYNFKLPRVKGLELTFLSRCVFKQSLH